MNKAKAFPLFFSILWLFLFFGSPPLFAQGFERNIEFSKSATRAVLKGKLTPWGLPEYYVFEGREGQKIEVKVSSKEYSPVFTIYLPGYKMAGTREGHTLEGHPLGAFTYGAYPDESRKRSGKWKGRLSQSGSYLIEVNRPSMIHEDMGYQLEVRLK